MTITDDDLKRLDDRYVTKAECEEKNDKTQDAIASMQQDMAVLCTKMTTTNKWLSVIGTAVITSVIGILVALIVWAIKSGGA